MGLLDNGIAGLAQELGQPTSTAKDAADTYRKPMGVDEFDSFGNSNLAQGEEAELARWQAPSGIERRWGFGRADQDATLGYQYAQLQNANSEQLHGKLIFKWENATGRESEVSDEADSQDMDTPNRYDREQQRPFPEQTDKEKAEQDQYLVVLFEPQTDPANITNDYAVDADASDVRWPTTEYDVS